MPKARAILAAPVALAYWLGVAGRDGGSRSGDVIFTYHATPRHAAARIERELRYLRRECEIVPLGSLADDVSEHRSGGTRRRAAITFDDGLRSNVSVVYPILRRLGIPATFFVCPGLIDEGRWLWTHEARRRLTYAEPGLRADLAAELDAPAEVEPFVRWMKTLDLSERRHVEARLRAATASFVPSPADRRAYDLAGWDELCALDPAIVTVGSHTMTHPILLRMRSAEIEAELGDSRRAIEGRLNRPAELFAYPNGDFDGEVLGVARRYYRAAVTIEPYVLAPGQDPHLLPRIFMPEGVLRLAWTLNRTLTQRDAGGLRIPFTG